MDPVSRQLAAAAMGLVFALSRDDELEKTRLDLERARMEREDFRNGGGPDTHIMHDAPEKGSLSQARYASAYKYLMRPRVEYQNTARKILKWSITNFDHAQEDLQMATHALARIARDGPGKRYVALAALEALSFDSEEVERVANDGQGAMRLGLPNDYEEPEED